MKKKTADEIFTDELTTKVKKIKRRSNELDKDFEERKKKLEKATETIIADEAPMYSDPLRKNLIGYIDLNKFRPLFGPDGKTIIAYEEI